MAASTLLLLVFSTRAAADGLDAAAVTASAPTGEAPAPVQAAPAPQAVASESAGVPEPEAGATAESDPPATPSAAPPTSPATHASTARLPEPDDLPSPATSANPNTHVVQTHAVHNVQKGAAGTDPVSELTRTANRAPANATAAIVDPARSTVKAVERVASVDQVTAPPDHPLQMASGASQMARGALPSRALGIAVPEGVEGLRSSGGVPLEAGADAPLPLATPAIPRMAPAEPPDSLGNSRIRHLLDHLAGLESLPPVTPVLPTRSSPGHRVLDPGGGDLDVSAGPVEGRFADSAPLDGNPPPKPAPGSSQDGAVGTGGTSFIPIAALLALLALAAPAIRCRPGEGPDLWPPAPFVCALERPG